ncbi:hypothetical protein ONZ45_g16869 [Pleurotus djamor]|nr:hypothetical protein ONZ45_g16869 [Pleurotus djamor]
MLLSFLSALALLAGVASASPMGNHSCPSEAAANKPAFVNQHEGVQYSVASDDPTIMNVPSYLGGSSATFHRAVFGAELPFINENYPMGQSPTRHGTSGGDFTIDGTGGLYVFDVRGVSYFETL